MVPSLSNLVEVRTRALASLSIVTLYMTNHLIESPYFFNAGSFHTSALLSAIAAAYAHTIISFLAANPTIPKPDVIFGYEPREVSFSSSNKPLTRDLADQLIKESHLLLQH